MKIDRRLLAWARLAQGWLAAAALLGGTAGLCTVLQARWLSHAVSQAFLGGKGLADVEPALLGLLLASLGRALATWGSEASAGQAAARVKTEVRARLVQHIQQLGPAFVRSERTGELVNTALAGVEALDAYFSQYLPGLALAALIPCAILVLILPLDPASGLVLLCTAPLIPLFMVLIGSLADEASRKQWASLSRMNAHFLDVLQGLATLKIFGRSRAQIEIIREVSDRFRDLTMSVLRVTFLSALALELLATLSTAIIAVEIGLRLLYPAGTAPLTFEQAFFVLILAPEFYLPLRMLGQRFHAGMAGVEAAQRILEVLATEPEGMANREPGIGSAPYPLAAAPHVRAPAISFRDVCYAYDGGRRPALQGVSFDILPGHKMALIGPTGSGKSTVIQLLLRFIEAQAGEITAGGVPLAAWPAPAWRGLVAWVPQAPYLFYGTVADNIRLGRPDATLEEVAWAAAQADADGFIAELPASYDTVIGERGARLSGGQAQRLALARAFLKDAPLLILDEATANLDAASAASVQAATARLLHGRSALIVTHRLQTIEDADRIVVLAGGVIREAGTHDELLAQGESLYHLLAGGAPCQGVDGAAGEQQRVPGEGQAHRGPTSGTGRLASLSAWPEVCPGTPDGALVAGARADWGAFAIPGGADAPSGSHGGGCSPGGPAAPGIRTIGRPGGPPNGEPGALRPTDPIPPRAAGCCESPAAHRLASRVFFRLLSFAAPLWPWIALSALLGLAAVGSGVALLATSAWIIATAALRPSIAVLEVAIVGVRFFGIARGVFRYLERLVSHEVTFRLLARLRVWFYTRLEPVAPAALARYHSGDLLARIVADIETLQNFYVRVIAPPLVALLATAGLALFFAGYSRGLAVALVCFLATAGLGVPWLVGRLAAGAGRSAVRDRAELSAALIDGIQGLPELLAYHREPAHLARIRALGQRLDRRGARMAVLRGLQGALGHLLTGLAVLAVLVLAIPLVTSARLSGVDLAVLALATTAAFESVQPLPLAAQYLSASLEAAGRLFDIAGEPSATEAQRDGQWEELVLPHGTPCPGSESCAAGPGKPIVHGRRAPALAVRDLAMRYRPGERLALAGLSFTLDEGDRLSVVGPSGAGKTTLVNVLLRFWDYQDGHVELGGRDLRSYSEEAARSRMAVVAQHTHLFNATIRDNLLLARPLATQAELAQAVRSAELDAFIGRLPEGWDTWVGEQGLCLSGGERQRLAIARALLKDAPLLILDEATANLDPLTEGAVLAAIGNLMKGRTVLTITHRLMGPGDNGRVLVLDAGHAVQEGNPATLLAEDGLYRRMWQSSCSWMASNSIRIANGFST